MSRVLFFLERFLPILSLLFVGACNSVPPDLHGSGPIYMADGESEIPVDREGLGFGGKEVEPLEKVDLVHELDPLRLGELDWCKKLNSSLGAGNVGERLNLSDRNDRELLNCREVLGRDDGNSYVRRIKPDPLSLAFHGFYLEGYGNSEKQKLRRNRIQDRITAASDRSCDRYHRRLNAVFSDVNFTLGSLTTVTGGLGALFADTVTSNSLAGAASILSGVRAEFNSDIFREKVAHALTKAMDGARKTKNQEMKGRRDKVINQYSVEEAIKDAIDYNSMCSLVAGLEAIDTAVTIYNDPGLKWLATVFKNSEAFEDDQLIKDVFRNLAK